MKVSEDGLNLIKQWEGYHRRQPDGSCRAYLDRLAKPHIWTCGWGCTKGVTHKTHWTREAAEDALMRELGVVEEIVGRAVTIAITQPHFDALVSFTYNVGPGGSEAVGLSNSTLLRKLNRGDFDGAEQQFHRWRYAGGKVYNGLIARRKAEAALFARGTAELMAKAEEHASDQAGERPQMPQRVSEAREPLSKGAAVSATAAAGGAATVASNAPVGAWETILNTMAALSAFAASHWATLLAIGALTGLVLALPSLAKLRTSG